MLHIKLCLVSIIFRFFPVGRNLRSGSMEVTRFLKKPQTQKHVKINSVITGLALQRDFYLRMKDYNCLKCKVWLQDLRYCTFSSK